MPLPCPTLPLPLALTLPLTPNQVAEQIAPYLDPPGAPPRGDEILVTPARTRTLALALLP
jgi:hypothetical protein